MLVLTDQQKQQLHEAAKKRAKETPEGYDQARDALLVKWGWIQAL
jgi:hypothetical protein